MALELRDDERSQRANWRAERFGWVGMLLIICAALLGFLGRGPFGETEVGDAKLSVQYDRIMRRGAPGVVTVRIGTRAAGDSTIHLWASRSVLRSCSPQRIVPTPERVTTDDDRSTFEINAIPGADSIVVILDCEPQRTGRYAGMIGLTNGPSVSLHSVVLP